MTEIEKIRRLLEVGIEAKTYQFFALVQVVFALLLKALPKMEDLLLIYEARNLKKALAHGSERNLTRGQDRFYDLLTIAIKGNGLTIPAPMIRRRLRNELRMSEGTTLVERQSTAEAVSSQLAKPGVEESLWRNLNEDLGISFESMKQALGCYTDTHQVQPRGAINTWRYILLLNSNQEC